MRSFSVFVLETKSFVTNSSALFWTAFYPVMMLVFLVVLFDPGDETSADFRFASVIGLTMLTLISTAIFGLAQALGESRAHNGLLFYAAAPMSYFDIAMAIVLSRMAIIIGFSVLFITASLFVLGLSYMLSWMMLLLGIVALGLASMFCFGLALMVARYCQNTQTMLAIANIVNIYALMSSNVFVPLSALPDWSRAFITTSPFFHLNNMLLGTFSGVNLPYVFAIGSTLCLLGLLLVWLASERSLFIAEGRAR